MLIRLSWLSDVGFVNLRFLAFGSSEKDDPCNELSLLSSFIASSFV